MDSKLKKTLKAIYRSRGYYGGFTRHTNLHNAINERGAMVERFADVAESGMVAECRSGMDCDCSSYSRVHVMPVPASIFAWQRGEEYHRSMLDGTESVYYVKPSSVDGDSYHSRDLALEAFEDGHSHIVYR